MDISKHIVELLYHNECVIIPGVGGFISNPSPARIVADTHEFFPPSARIAFNAGLAANDGLLANHIAKVENTSYRESLYEIKQWVDDCLTAIKNGKNVKIEGLGVLSANASGNIEFEPSYEINFNHHAFGLPVFTATPVNTVAEPIAELQSEKRNRLGEKARHLIPETLKWAAVLAPFIAFAMWATFNGKALDNYVHNYTGMFSWVRSTPGKTIPAAQYPLQTNTEKQPEIKSPASALAENTISISPAEISHGQLDKYNLKIQQPAQETVAATTQTGSFCIVAGAFREIRNAQNLVTNLTAKGYPAAIVEKTSGGLHVVSIKSFDTAEEAKIELPKLVNNGFPEAWVLKRSKI